MDFADFNRWNSATNSEESVYIFSTLSIEPLGHIGSGVAELIASLLLLVPQTVTIGAILALGVISAAILAHLTKLGIKILGDGRTLFMMACTVFVATSIILFLRRKEILIIDPKF